MTDGLQHNRAFRHSTAFFRTLCRLGVRHIVISPGSRSTPLTLAAAAHPGLDKHVILDERSAAFTALGIGKASGLPAVLVCTSGTAAAHYYPAVIEAKQSAVPLIIASADRPPRLRNTDANQTIDQRRLFGSFTFHFEDVAPEDSSIPDMESTEEKTGRWFNLALKNKGPVHINFAFDKPLEPDPGLLAETRDDNEKLKTPPSSGGAQSGTFEGSETMRRTIRASERPLVVAGQLATGTPLEPIFELADLLGAPVLTEAGFRDGSNAIQGFEGFLRTKSICANLEPDLILRFGRQPASKSLLMALDQWQPETHIFFSRPADTFTTSLRVTATVEWPGGSFALSGNTGTAKTKGWLDRWKKTESHFIRRRTAQAAAIDTLTDGHVYEHLADLIPDDWTLFFSNSFPVRDRSLFGQWGNQIVFTNRGASGIDGITSTAIGIGLASGRPGVLFTGDLAFLHDTNALLNHRLLKHPLLAVVINNSGGSIFRMLPIADHSEYFEPYFETPQQAGISTLADAYGIDCTEVSTLSGLKTVEPAELPGSGGSKLHILECRTDPGASMKLRRKLWEAES